VVLSQYIRKLKFDFVIDRYTMFDAQRVVLAGGMVAKRADILNVFWSGKCLKLFWRFSWTGGFNFL
jgi:hypothetical protein